MLRAGTLARAVRNTLPLAQETLGTLAFWRNILRGHRLILT